MRTPTWKVLKWTNRPESPRSLMVPCPECGREAELAVGRDVASATIACIGLTLLFDPPGFIPRENSMAEVVQCRHCRKKFEKE